RDAQRVVVGLMLRQLGHYVEIACENEMAKFITSGFEPVPSVFAPPAPPPRPIIKKIKHGVHSGELLISFSSHYRKAVHYKLRYVEGEFHDIAGLWAEITVPSSRPATLISGLKPGQVYTFQVRTFGRDGTFSDWSDAASRMCV